VNTLLDIENFEFKEVRLLDSEGTQIGIVSVSEAIRIAQDEYNLDLVVVSDTTNPPVCKILDFNKFKYEHNKKQKEIAKRNKSLVVETKELWFRPNTDEHDIEIKVKQARDFFNKNYRVKFGVKFRGRENAHRDIGRNLINHVVSLIGDCSIEQALNEQERSITIVLGRKKA
jgi:translation initiation factor IF-3